MTTAHYNPQRLTWALPKGGIPALAKAFHISWNEFAACREADPEAFFPPKGSSPAPAKRVCRRCLVRTECLEYALERGERYGVWGGLTGRERRALLKARRKANVVHLDARAEQSQHERQSVESTTQAAQMTEVS